MVILKGILAAYAADKPLQRINVLGCMTITPETGACIDVLKKLGANIRWSTCSPLATDDDVAKYLRGQRLNVFGKSNMSGAEFEEALDRSLGFTESELRNPVYVIDDVSQITSHMVRRQSPVLGALAVISETTKSGITSLRGSFDRKELSVPAFNVNDTGLKTFAESYLGVSESTTAAFNRATNMSVKGKKIAVIGYGPVGEGLAEALRGDGARVAVLSKDVMHLLKARLKGFNVPDRKQALEDSDIIFTATGFAKTISAEDMFLLRDGVILCNIGHGNDEYDYPYLSTLPSRQVGDYMTEHKLPNGKRIYSTCHGRLINFGAASANSPESMDFTFGLHIGNLLEYKKRPQEFEPGIIRITEKQEIRILGLGYPDLIRKARCDGRHPC